MERKKAIIAIGVSASGKTTWAKEFINSNENFVIICRDDIRASLTKENFTWSSWNWKLEPKVTEMHNNAIMDAWKNDKNIIIADTNLNPKFRIPLIEKLKRMNYNVEEKIFDISQQEAIERDSNRGDLSVGAKVIAQQYLSYLQYKEDMKK